MMPNQYGFPESKIHTVTHSPSLPCFSLNKKEKLILAIKEYCDATEQIGVKAEALIEQTQRGRGGFWNFTLSWERRVKRGL